MNHSFPLVFACTFRHSSFASLIRHSNPRIAIFLFSIFYFLLTLTGCGNRTIRIDLVPTADPLTPQIVESSDAGLFTSDKIALINVSGMISNSKSGGILGGGSNPVSEFRQTLDAIAKDNSVKAVVLRINSPGGTVTASDIMYRDLLAFKAKTHKPVITSMLDICASGGYYLSCASDYRIAYPTTITGSIGVIVETVNINGTLHKLGIASEAVKSGPNKDMASPFKPAESPDKPLTDNDRELLQKLVNDFYAGFKGIVKASPNKITDKDWPMVTDGRIVTGKDAATLGLIDQTGTLDDALAKAKELAHIQKAKVIIYTRTGDYKGSAYAHAPVGQGPTQVNMLNLNVDLGDILPRGQSQFLYLWTGFDTQDQ